MASYNYIDAGQNTHDVTMRAEAAMATNYVVVMLSATQGMVKVPAGTTSVPYGILQTTAAAAGDPVTVRPISSGKRSLVCAHADFALGDALAIAATTGRVDTAASTLYPIGLALELASAQGNLVTCQLGGALIPRAS
jgi:hypothetical protein